MSCRVASSCFFTPARRVTSACLAAKTSDSLSSVLALTSASAPRRFSSALAIVTVWIARSRSSACTLRCIAATPSLSSHSTASALSSDDLAAITSSSTLRRVGGIDEKSTTSTRGGGGDALLAFFLCSLMICSMKAFPFCDRSALSSSFHLAIPVTVRRPWRGAALARHAEEPARSAEGALSPSGDWKALELCRVTARMAAT
mmetsp:Transcript_16177/g.39415  ORF Transcript_16177/g.39415 Transcript_16177/m.39415 type:complete len:202 (+) Transcript_16177:403-1008(+)